MLWRCNQPDQTWNTKVNMHLCCSSSDYAINRRLDESLEMQIYKCCTACISLHFTDCPSITVLVLPPSGRASVEDVEITWSPHVIGASLWITEMNSRWRSPSQVSKLLNCAKAFPKQFFLLVCNSVCINHKHSKSAPWMLCILVKNGKKRDKFNWQNNSSLILCHTQGFHNLTEINMRLSESARCHQCHWISQIMVNNSCHTGWAKSTTWVRINLLGSAGQCHWLSLKTGENQV